MKHLQFIRLSAICGIFFPIIAFLLIFILGYYTPEYSHLEDFISQIWATGSRFESAGTVFIFLIGLLSLIFSIGFYLAIDEDKFSYYNLILLIIFSFSLIFLGLFPCSSECGGKGITLHFIFTFIACASLGFSPLLFYFVAKTDKRWKSLDKTNLLFFFLSAIFLVLYAFFYRDYKGLFQRAYFLVCFLWVEIISLKLFKLSKTNRIIKKRACSPAGKKLKSFTGKTAGKK